MSLYFYLLIFLITGYLHLGRAHSPIHFPQHNEFDYNSICQIKHNGETGNCRRLSECTSAQLTLKNDQIHPSLCFFDRFEPIVCCSKQELPEIGNKLQNKTSANIQHNPNKNVQKLRSSEKYCFDSYLKKEDDREFHITVVGGEDASPGEFPYMAAIGWKHEDGRIDYNCGGFMVSETFVITAAHCTSLGGVEPNVVLPGGINLSEQPDDLPILPVVKIYRHPQYRPNQSYNDIAIIQLKQITPYKVACLWQTYSTQDLSEIIAIGYGHTQFAGRRSDQLQKVKLKLFSNSECNTFYSQGSELRNGIVDSQVCAGDLSAVRDTCQGDSGGPIIINKTINDTSIPYIIGVTSFGQGCAGGAPSIYTRISSYLDWIESIVWK